MPLAPRTAQAAGRDGQGRRHRAEDHRASSLYTQCVCRTRIREALLSPLSSYFWAGLVYLPATCPLLVSHKNLRVNATTGAVFVSPSNPTLSQASPSEGTAHTHPTAAHSPSCHSTSVCSS